MNLVECNERGDSQHLSIGAVYFPVGNFAAFENEVLNNATRTVVFGQRLDHVGEEPGPKPKNWRIQR